MASKDLDKITKAAKEWEKKERVKGNLPFVVSVFVSFPKTKTEDLETREGYSEAIKRADDTKGSKLHILVGKPIILKTLVLSMFESIEETEKILTNLPKGEKN